MKVVYRRTEAGKKDRAIRQSGALWLPPKRRATPHFYPHLSYSPWFCWLQRYWSKEIGKWGETVFLWWDFRARADTAYSITLDIVASIFQQFRVSKSDLYSYFLSDQHNTLDFKSFELIYWFKKSQRHILGTKCRKN